MSAGEYIFEQPIPLGKFVEAISEKQWPIKHYPDTPIEMDQASALMMDDGNYVYLYMDRKRTEVRSIRRGNKTDPHDLVSIMFEKMAISADALYLRLPEPQAEEPVAQ